MSSISLIRENFDIINQNISNRLENERKLEKTAHKVCCAGLTILATAVTITALFYASPVIPFACTVIAPIFFVALALLSASNARGMNLSGNSGSYREIWEGILKLTAIGGYRLGKMIYTAEVAATVGLANAGAAVLAMPFILGGGCSAALHHCRAGQYEKLSLQLDAVHQNEKATLPPAAEAALLQFIKN